MCPNQSSLVGEFMKRSILRNLLAASIVFWVLVGVLFPSVARLVTEWDPGLLGWAALILLLSPVLGVANYWLVNTILLRKLKHISAAANAISQNDLNVACEVESHDLIGEIVGSFNAMRDNLRGIIHELSGATTQVAAAAEELSAVTDETSRGVQNQQVEIEHVATAMNQMTATVQEVAHNAALAAQSAQQADREAKGGALVATEALGGIDNLVNEMERASGVIHKLENESESIGMVLDVIRGIAEQTNLLALNAAIEAARAGEQGRGFAVVADEVRTLASRTQKSTQEIQQMIERLQVGAGDAVRVMNEARGMAQGCSDQVEKAAESLGGIAGSVSQINDMNTQIASAAEEQSAVAAEINANVSNIRDVADQAAAGAQQTASASDELARLSAQLQGLMGRFRM